MKKNNWIWALLLILFLALIIVIALCTEKANNTLKRLRAEKEKELNDLFEELEEKELKKYELDKFAKNIFVGLKLSSFVLFIGLNFFVSCFWALEISNTILTCVGLYSVLHFFASSIIANRIVGPDELLCIISTLLTNYVYKRKGFSLEEINQVRNKIERVKQEITEIDRTLNEEGSCWSRNNSIQKRPWSS
jgi:hypothetical protein